MSVVSVRLWLALSRGHCM